MNSAGASPVDVWTAGASGAWMNSSNWSLGRAPLSGDIVDIESGSPIVVTYDAGSLSLGGLTLVGATLDLLGTGGSGMLTSNGATTLQNAAIDGLWSMTLAGASTIKALTVGGSVHLINKGAVTQSGGAVAIGDSAASTAFIVNAVGATWIISDDSGMTQGSTTGWRFYNNGTFQKTSGSGVIAKIQANFRSTGTIASASGGDIEFDGKMTSLSGTYIGSGMVDYGPDGLSTIFNVDVTASCCQTNWGTVDLVGTMTMNDGSTIMNASGAHWNFDGDSSLLPGAGQAAGPDINGMGVIAKTKGKGTSHIGIVATAEGVVSVATGTLSFEGATSTFSSTINGAGTFQIGGGAATIASGARLAVSLWTLAGGVTTLGENVAYAGAFTGEAGAGLALGGYTLSTSGATTLSGLTLSGSGVLRLASATTVSGLTIGGVATVAVAAEVMQGAGDNVTLGDALVANAAHLTIGAGGRWILNGGALELGADPASAIVIAPSATTPGLLGMSGGGTSTVAPTLYNNASNAGATLGGVEASSGVLDFQGKVYGTGSANIVGGATLEFDNYVASGQTALFSGSNGALSIHDLTDFHAGISGFDTAGSDDALLIAGGWSFAGATETTSAAMLSFTQGALHRSLTLQGDYTAGAFSAATMGGELKITF